LEQPKPNTKEEEEELAKKVARLNEQLRAARGEVEIPPRICLVFSKSGSLVPVEVVDVEMSFFDQSVIIKGKAIGVIREPTHLEISQLIQHFLAGKDYEGVEKIESGA